MPQFKVQGLQAGRPVSQKVKAASVDDARQMLRRSGIYVRDITEVKSGFDLGQLEMSMATIKTRDKAVFSRQFAALINAGVSMVRSLTIMHEQTDNPKLKKYLQTVKSEVEQGKNLSDAIRKYPDSFDGLYCAMVQAGEVGGGIG